MYLLLYILWILLNGKITAEICLIGLLAVALTGVLSYFLLGYTPKREARLLRCVPLFMAYLAVLLWEIIKANIVVLHFITNERAKLEPTLISFDIDLNTEFSRFVLANSITLTPGTITVLTNNDRFTVHALRPDLLDGIENGAFVKLLRRMEG